MQSISNVCTNGQEGTVSTYRRFGLVMDLAYISFMLYPQRSLGNLRETLNSKYEKNLRTV